MLSILRVILPKQSLSVIYRKSHSGEDPNFPSHGDGGAGSFAKNLSFLSSVSHAI